MRDHTYEIRMDWIGNAGSGTAGYQSYRRDFTIESAGKPPIAGSSDPAFRGDPDRYNPEELLVASLSSCHMLWYLHLCSVNDVVVLSYSDHATGAMRENPDGSGQFTGVGLNPTVTISRADARQRALALHEEAHKLCFIARSVNFPVEVAPMIEIAWA